MKRDLTMNKFNEIAVFKLIRDNMVTRSGWLFLVATILLSIMLVACNSKTSYINSFERFVNKVENKANTYTSEDWKRADVEFEKYTDEYFNKKQSSLTESDKKKIGRLHARYFTIRAKAYGKQLKEGLEDVTTFLEGFLEGLTEETKNTDNQ